MDATDCADAGVSDAGSDGGILSKQTERRRRFKAGIDLREVHQRRIERTVALHRARVDGSVASARQWPDLAVLEAAVASGSGSGNDNGASGQIIAQALHELRQAFGDATARVQQQQQQQQQQPRRAHYAQIGRAVAVLRRVAQNGAEHMVQQLLCTDHPALLLARVLADTPLPAGHALCAFQRQCHYDTAWVLINMAAISVDASLCVVRTGGLQHALPLLAHYYQAGDSALCEQLLWLVGNCVSDSPAARDDALRSGALAVAVCLAMRSMAAAAAVEAATEQHVDESTRTATYIWAASALCSDTPRPAAAWVASAIAPLARVLDAAVLHGTDGVTGGLPSLVLRTLWRIAGACTCDDSVGTAATAQALLRAGMVPALVTVVRDYRDCVDAQLYAAALLTHVTAAGDDDTGVESAVRCGVVAALATCFMQQLAALGTGMLPRGEAWLRRRLCTQACMVFSNVAAGDSGHVAALLRDGGMQLPQALEALLYSSSHNSAGTDAVDDVGWVVANAVWSATMPDLQLLVTGYAALPRLVGVLRRAATRPGICSTLLEVVLCGLERLLYIDAVSAQPLGYLQLAVAAGVEEALDALQHLAYESASRIADGAARVLDRVVQTYFGNLAAAAEPDDDSTVDLSL